MDIGYLWEKLLIGVDTLLGEAPLQDRLRYSVMSFDTLKPEDFPTEETRERFARLMESVTCTPGVGNDGSFKASIDAMTADERRRIAREILSLFVDIARRHAWGDFEHQWLQGRGPFPTGSV